MHSLLDDRAPGAHVRTHRWQLTMANQLWDQLQDYLQCMTSKPIVIGY